MINYEKSELSLKRLEEQHDNCRSPDEGLPELTREGIAESVIQRFETCYDCLWKALKRYLNEKLGIADLPSSPKPLIRLAHENGLLASSLEDCRSAHQYVARSRWRESEELSGIDARIY